jgi:hypothetical protein
MAKRIDWEAIEPDWRAGVKTKKQMSVEYSVSRAAMDKHFSNIGVERDLTAQIKAKADAIVTRSQVTREVTPLSKVTVQEIIEVNAKIQSDIILAHRTDIPKKRELVAKLFAEVEALTDGGDIVEQMTLALGGGDMEQLADAARKVVSLPSRVKCAVDLMNGYKTVVGMERQAFGVDKELHNDKDPLAQILDAVAARRNPLVEE